MPIAGGDHAYPDPVSRNSRISKVIGIADRTYAAIFDAVAFILVRPEQGTVFSAGFVEVNAVVAAHEAQMGHGCQKVLALVIDYARIREIQSGIVGVDLHDAKCFVFENRERNDAGALFRAFGYTQQQPGFSVEAEDSGVEQTCDLHAGS